MAKSKKPRKKQVSKLTQKAERERAEVQKKLLHAFRHAQNLTYKDEATWVKEPDQDAFKTEFDGGQITIILSANEAEKIYTLSVQDAGPADAIPTLTQEGAESELGLFYRDLDAQQEAQEMRRADIAPRMNTINTRLNEILNPPPPPE